MWKEKRRYIRKLGSKSAINLVKLWVSFYVSKILRRPWIWGKPTSLTIEPTTACNLGCPECPSGLKVFTRPTGNLKAETVDVILDELSGYLTYANFYFQGEPYIHKSFLEMVKKTSEAGVFTTTSTNAHFLTEEMAEKTVKSGLDKLIISLDGITQKTYESYRINGELDKVLEGTRNIVASKKKLSSKSPLVVFQFLVVKPNEHEIEEAIALAKKMGVDDIVFKTAQIYEFKHGSPLIPDKVEYSRYKKLPDGTYAIKNRLENQCWRMWRGSVITWDGKVVPCCFDKDAKYEMGNVKNLRFHDIWHSDAYNSFRKGVLTSRNQIDICKNCSEGTKVWG